MRIEKEKKDENSNQSQSAQKVKPGFRRIARLEKKEDFLPSFTKSFISFIFEVLKIVIISLAIIIPIRFFLIQPFYVRGSSMEPNFYDNEYLVINEITYRFSEPDRGDVVVINERDSMGEYIIKRIIGLPGEKVQITGGKVIIYNQDYPEGKVLKEEYLEKGTYTSGNVIVELEDDEYFVLGDNREFSLDSRSFGPVKKDDIVGYAWLRAWPVYKMKYFISPEYNL